jgi:hypothetical protein
MQARVDASFARELVDHDAAVLGLLDALPGDERWLLTARLRQCSGTGGGAGIFGGPHAAVPIWLNVVRTRRVADAVMGLRRSW